MVEVRKSMGRDAKHGEEDAAGRTFFAPTRVALPSRGSHHAYHTLVGVMIPRMSCRRQEWGRAAPSRCPRLLAKDAATSFHLGVLLSHT